MSETERFGPADRLPVPDRAQRKSRGPITALVIGVVVLLAAVILLTPSTRPGGDPNALFQVQVGETTVSLGAGVGAAVRAASSGVGGFGDSAATPGIAGSGGGGGPIVTETQSLCARASNPLSCEAVEHVKNLVRRQLSGQDIEFSEVRFAIRDNGKPVVCGRYRIIPGEEVSVQSIFRPFITTNLSSYNAIGTVVINQKDQDGPFLSPEEEAMLLNPCFSS